MTIISGEKIIFGEQIHVGEILKINKQNRGKENGNMEKEPKKVFQWGVKVI